MKQFEIPIEELSEIEVLGENPVYRFEEIINDINQNDLGLILNGYLRLDIDPQDISDYEINSDNLIIYTGDEVT